LDAVLGVVLLLKLGVRVEGLRLERVEVVLVIIVGNDEDN
jgi:hypothetical protein